MKKLVCILFALLACAPQMEAQKSNDQLRTLFKSYYLDQMEQFPEWASYNGIHTNSDKLTDNSLSAIQKRRAQQKVWLKTLGETDYKSLSAADKLNYDLFEAMIMQELNGDKFKDYLTPVGQQGGIHLQFPQIIEYQPVSTQADIDKYFTRLKAFPQAVEVAIGHMQNGLEEGIVPPHFLMNQVVDQINNIKNVPVAEMPFMSVFEKENDLDETELAAAKEACAEILVNEVVPAYEQLAAFMKDDYIPNCRKEAGIWSLPQGEERYAYAVKYHTSTDLTPDEIFDIGNAEVKRIKAEMDKVKDEIGFKGSLQEFVKDLRSNPKYYYETKEPMMAEYRRILAIMDKQLPDIFGILPEAPYDLKEMEAYRAKSAPQAYYYAAPEDRSRPGYFYVNTTNLPARPKYTMTALALHEAVPGHHLQIAIAQELKGMPWFRREYNVTAYVEGWGLYAEYLGYETNMYEDPLQHFGALTFEMWRACRLVVDVGIHHKKWQRDEAVRFMLENTPNSEADIRSEVDRYISWPGQALAYKIGELKLKELRQKAEREMGNKFDLKAFHDCVLENGAIPLSLLEEKVNQWIRSTK